MIVLLILAQWVVPLLLIALGVRWLVRRIDANRAANPPVDPALTVLRERYARGEIDATEFEERRRTLGG